MRHLFGSFAVVAVAFVVGCSSQARPQTSNDAASALKTDVEENSIGKTTLTSAEIAPRTPLLPWDDAPRQANTAPLPSWDDVVGPKPVQTWGEAPKAAEPAAEALPDTRE